MRTKIKTRTVKAVTLDMIVDDWKDCTLCEIGKHVRKHVFLDTLPAGLEKTDIVFIGEGPGQIEDVKGLPFVGPAGQLLRKAIEDADPNCKTCDGSGYDDGTGNACGACLGNGYIRIGLTNLLVCRPYAGKPIGTGNRPPAEEEVMNCLPRLVEMIKTLNPYLLFLAGKEAESYIPLLREELFDNGFIQGGFVPIKHPSALLRQGGANGGMLYEQYVDQIRSYFNLYFRVNKLRENDRNSRLPEKERETRK